MFYYVCFYNRYKSNFCDSYRSVNILNLVILILNVTTIVFANSMLNPSIAYGKNKAMSDTIAENNLEQPSSPVTQQSASDTNQVSFKNIANNIYNQSPTLGHTVLRIQSFTAVVESTLAIFYHWSLSVDGMVE